MTVPKAIQTFIDATNDGDTAAFLGAFAPDATLDDWGRTFTGRDGVARWNETDNIGVQARFDLVGIVDGPDADAYVVTLKVSGNGYNGTGPMTFVLAGDRIASLVIGP